MSDQLPTALLVEATLTPLNGRGIFYYITNKGNHAYGVIMLKLSDTKGQCSLRKAARKAVPGDKSFQAGVFR